jgi:chromosome segregation ATPase
MKRILLVIAIAATFTGCENYTAQIEQLKMEKDSVIALANEKDTQLGDFVATVTEIESNLATVTEKQGMIKESISNDPEKIKNSKVRINEQIAAINTLMDENKSKIAAINKKLKSSRRENSKLQKLVESLNEQLVVKDAELAELNGKLVSLNAALANINTEVNTLKTEKEQQAAVITNQTTKLNTAYVAVGTYKQLHEKKLVNKEGGVLGIRTEKKIDASVGEESYNKIDITQTSKIEINSKDAEVVTAHPLDSYKLVKSNNEKEVSYLEITDPEKFWKASKYLVVVKD